MAKTNFSFEKAYPNLVWYMENLGTIEMGSDDHYDSWLRLTDEGGMRYESEEDGLDEALKAAEEWVGEEFEGEME